MLIESHQIDKKTNMKSRSPQISKEREIQSIPETLVC